MNAHWTFFYYIAAFVIGMFSAGLATLTFLKTGAVVVRSYLWFYVSLTLTLAVDMFVAYTETNLSAGNGGWANSLFFVSIASSSFIVWTFPVFVHTLYDLPSWRKRNLIAGILAFLRFIGLCGCIWFNRKHGTAASVTFFHLFDLILAGIIVYGAWISVRHYICERAASRRMTAGPLAGVFLILAAVTLEDQVLGIIENIWLYPLVYALSGSFFSCHFLKRYWPRLARTIHVTPSSAQVQTPDIDSDSEKATDDVEASFRASSDQYGISPREQDVLRLLLQGRTNVQIADILKISTNTVKTHIGNIYGKVGVNRRYELIAKFSNIISSGNTAQS